MSEKSSDAKAGLGALLGAVPLSCCYKQATLK